MVPTGGVVRINAGRHEVDAAIEIPSRPITLAGVVDGDGIPISTVDAEQSSSTVVVASGATGGTVIRDLRITGGDAVLGGGLRINNASPNVTNCVIEFNLATLGAGVYCGSASEPTFTRCRIEGNGGTGTDVGGGIYASPTALPELIETTVCGNVPNQIFGPFTTDSASCEDSLCDNCLSACDADLNGDGKVDGADLGLFLIEWGPCSGFCPADLNRDTEVNGADLGLLLLEIGPCEGD